mmetsp:Transcript_20090/g.33177  ORF Transcript_20090/g.33177 Transcript_20090/m.33177 type:complete len:274 (+) Transcript_20090:3-824(+)
MMETDEDVETKKSKKKKSRKKTYGHPLKDALLSREKRSNLPRECVHGKVDLSLRCNIAYVDIEGLAKQNDIMSILNVLKPKKVVIVHGDEQATDAMVRACQSNNQIQFVEAPRVNETIDISSDLGMWRVELDRGLFDQANPLYTDPRSLTVRKKKKIGIRYVEGEVVNEAEGISAKIPKIVPLKQDSTRTVEPKFVHGQEKPVTLQRIYAVLLDHDLDSDFKIEASLEPRVIVCKDAVTVRAAAQGHRVHVEGPVSRTFFTVKKLVLSCYTLV